MISLPCGMKVLLDTDAPRWAVHGDDQRRFGSSSTKLMSLLKIAASSWKAATKLSLDAIDTVGGR